MKVGGADVRRSGVVTVSGVQVGTLTAEQRGWTARTRTGETRRHRSLRSAVQALARGGA